jgi:hypothetical protein
LLWVVDLRAEAERRHGNLTICSHCTVAPYTLVSSPLALLVHVFPFQLNYSGFVPDDTGRYP